MREGGDLYDGDVQEDTTETDRNGRGGHDSWTSQESHGHREPCDPIPTRYDPRLQCHEQTCIQTTIMAYVRHIWISFYVSMYLSLNCAGP